MHTAYNLINSKFKQNFRNARLNIAQASDWWGELTSTSVDPTRACCSAWHICHLSLLHLLTFFVIRQQNYHIRCAWNARCIVNQRSCVRVHISSHVDYVNIQFAIRFNSKVRWCVCDRLQAAEWRVKVELKLLEIIRKSAYKYETISFACLQLENRKFECGIGGDGGGFFHRNGCCLTMLILLWNYVE